MRDFLVVWMTSNRSLQVYRGDICALYTLTKPPSKVQYKRIRPKSEKWPKIEFLKAAIDLEI